MMRPTSNQVRGEGKRVEISNVPLERTKTVKTDIPVQITRKDRDTWKKTRVTLHVPPLPMVNKSYVCIDTNDSTKLTIHKDIPKPKELEVDKIIRRYQRPSNRHHPVLVIITPSRLQKNQHKLHVIDRITRTHLGVSTIKRKDFLQIQRRGAMQNYSIIVANRYLNIKKLGTRTALIPNLVRAANLDCCRDKECTHEECRQHAKKRKAKVKQSCEKSSKPDFSSSQTDSHFQSTSSATQCPTHRPRKCSQLPPIKIVTPCTSASRAMSSNTTYTVPSRSFIRKEAEKLFDSWSAFRIMEPRQKLSFMELVRRINVSPITSHYFQDLQLFFEMIKNYNVKVYIRPELCPKTESCEEGFSRYRLPRFNIECFTLGLTYIGGITLDSQQLEQQLLQHVEILPQVKVITDVCEITPLPRAIFVVLRALCELLCLELLYDAFGEFVFGLYNRID